MDLALEHRSLFCGIQHTSTADRIALQQSLGVVESGVLVVAFESSNDEAIAFIKAAVSHRESPNKYLFILRFGFLVAS